jgi:hypothetical protein
MGSESVYGTGLKIDHQAESIMWLEGKVADPVEIENTAVGIRHADHRKIWH